MNILPHKSWHVRTKKNIARVRKDEAAAAEEEKERQRKIALAGQESRTALLRQRASQRLVSASTSAPAGSVELDQHDLSISLAPVNDIVQADGHVNFFMDVDQGQRQGGVNPEAEQEKKKEQEEYEKKIGYLVYLGQDSEEASKTRPWYATIERGSGAASAQPKVKEGFEKVKNFENSGYLQGLSKKCELNPEELKVAKFKSFQDPLGDIRRYLKTPGIAAKLKEKGHKKKENPITHESRKRKRSQSPILSSSHSHKKSKKSKSEKKKKSKKSKHRSKDKKHGKKHSESSSKSKSPTKSSSSEEDSEDERKRKNLEKLRSERLQREREERRRTDQLMAKLRGEKPPEEVEKEKAVIAEAERDGGTSVRTRVKQKYNAQFNPEFARQNYQFS